MFELMSAMPESTSELAAIRREATTLGGGVLLRLRQLHRISRLRGHSPFGAAVHLRLPAAPVRVPVRFPRPDLAGSLADQYGRLARSGSWRWESSRPCPLWRRWSTIIPTGRWPKSRRPRNASRPASWGIRCCRTRRASRTTSRSGRPVRSSWSPARTCRAKARCCVRSA